MAASSIHAVILILPTRRADVPRMHLEFVYFRYRPFNRLSKNLNYAYKVVSHGAYRDKHMHVIAQCVCKLLVGPDLLFIYSLLMLIANSLC